MPIYLLNRLRERQRSWRGYRISGQKGDERIADVYKPGFWWREDVCQQVSCLGICRDRMHPRNGT